jgi:hypothetical protein
LLLVTNKREQLEAFCALRVVVDDVLLLYRTFTGTSGLIGFFSKIGVGIAVAAFHHAAKQKKGSGLPFFSASDDDIRTLYCGERDRRQSIIT